MEKYIILSFVLSSHLISSITCADELKCKDFAAQGCKCYEAPKSQIYCTDNVRADDLAKLPEWLKNKTFDYLHIYNSNLENINSRLFGFFENIFIEKNEKLIDIKGTPGIVVKPKVISIIDNVNFKGTELNQIIIAYKDSLVRLELNNNSISSLPVINDLPKLNIILLNNQNVNADIEIPTNFLKNITNLSELSLAGNKIKIIKENAIDLSSNNAKTNIAIFLDENKITDDSLKTTTIVIGNATKAIIGLDLQKNEFGLNIKKCIDLFKAIVDLGGHVYLNGDKINCVCEDLKTIHTTNIDKNIWGAKCTQGNDTQKVDLRECAK